MPNSKNGPRSDFSMLPAKIRHRLIFLLDDGATFKAIAADPEIAEAYRGRGLNLTPPALSRIRKSAEYQDIVTRRANLRSDTNAETITSSLLVDAGIAETVSDQVRVALWRLVQDCVQANPDDPKEVERLVRSMTNLTQNKAAELQRKLEDAKHQAEAAEAEWRTREAELMAQIAQLTKASDKPMGNPAAVADELKRQLGVK